MAGPFSDDAGGLVVIEVVDEAEAQEIFANDPGLISDVFNDTLHLKQAGGFTKLAEDPNYLRLFLPIIFRFWPGIPHRELRLNVLQITQ